MGNDQQPCEKQRIALVIQYLGTHFHGWQRQLNQRTVQEEIEKVLQSVLKKRVNVSAAGRTDAGVHAAAQVAHFDTQSRIPPHRWAGVLNAQLPEDIIVRGSVGVDPDWHARFSASSRRYRYTLYTEKRPNLFVQPYAWHYYYAPLDQSLIQAALNPLIGYHDLEAFRRAGSARSHSWVEVQSAECKQQGPFIHIEVQANGFLYGMMRLLVGMLVEVGCGERSLANFTQIWMEGRREEVKYAAPPQGLCLLQVDYPAHPFPREVWCDTMPKLFFESVWRSAEAPTIIY